MKTVTVPSCNNLASPTLEFEIYVIEFFELGLMLVLFQEMCG